LVRSRDLASIVDCIGVGVGADREIHGAEGAPGIEIAMPPLVTVLILPDDLSAVIDGVGVAVGAARVI
jgi:hypothetical protein